jgi:hypothetical protein
MLDVPIYGRISVMELFQPPVRRPRCVALARVPSCSAVLFAQGEAKALLFILTERHKFCVLEYNAAAGACGA